MKTQLVLHGLTTGDVPNLRLWSPADPATVSVFVMASIGHRSVKGTDDFTIRVATPAGLSALTAKQGVLAQRPLLVIETFEFDILWRWFQDLIEKCDGPSWTECRDRLRRHLDWEYDSLEK